MRFRLPITAAFVAALALSPIAAFAQSGGSSSDQSSTPSAAALTTTPTLTATPQAQPAPPPVRTSAPPTLVTAADGATAPVFGSQLFSGAFSAARPTKLSSYVIQPGDQIAVRIYGAINIDSVQTVDTAGALFIQGIGPVQVSGSPASELQGRLATALRAVYTDAVGVYVDILQGGTQGVFLAGNVTRPGRYLGSPNDSVLFFLDQAGGIDPERGSYRAVQVRRNGSVIATFDLYDFMTAGRLAPFTFQDGDVIYVAPRGSMVVVTGAVKNQFGFEAAPGTASISGQDLLALARASGTATSVGVTSVRDGSRQAAYFPMDQFPAVLLGSGDHVNLQSDVFTETISVTTQGDIRGPSIFVLPRGAMLSQLLQQLPLEGSDVEPTYVHIERSSVALEQRDALNHALDNLERAALTQPAYSSQGAATASTQAALVTQFVERARQTVPSGKIAVYTDGEFHDIRLQSGDRVVLPARSDVIIVAGEVLSPGAFAWADDLRITDYINRAGGASQNADRRNYALRRPDGSATVVRGNAKPRPGDQIVVVPGFPSRSFLLFKDLTAVAFQIATTAAAVIRITE